MKPKSSKPSIETALMDTLLVAQTPVLPPPERALSLRQRVLERARREQPAEAAPARPAPGSVDHLTIRGVEGIWVPLLPGVSMKLLREDETTRSYLLRLEAGARLPAHGHDQDEECMVLEGDIWLGDVHAHAGDYHLARGGLPHGMLRTDGGCLLFLRGQKHYARLRAG
ncbi:MAG TPA: cupin domain-containing protein [Thiobacillaceae bacterium]|nr:cupin domain-containing protein [Thiobacillaceae bacterium]HNA80973.1 cupin domain-containing protein [Thiobacillaceae bacterium]HNH89953.1 cupin domain-containing protein [Thiobacillaceae bacterium]